MKRLIHIFALIALLSIAGCTKRPTIPGMPFWTATGDARFDSLTSAYVHNDRHDHTKEKADLRDTMLAIAERTDNKLIKARAYYLACNTKYDEEIDSVSSRRLLTALTLIDSANDPHDYNIILWYSSHFSTNYTSGHRQLTQAMNYFKQIGDTGNYTAILTELASLCFHTFNSDKAYSLSLKADSLFALTNPRRQHFNKLNLALYSPDSLKAERLRLLLTDTVMLTSPYEYHNVLKDYYLVTDSIEYLKKAIATLDSLPELKSDKFCLYYLIADHSTRHGNPVRAMEYLRKAWTYRDEETKPRYLATFFQTLGHTYYRLGEKDSAFIALSQHVELQREIILQNHANGVAAAEFNRELEEARFAAKVRIEHSRMAASVVVASALLAIALIALIIHHRRTRRAMERLRLEADLRQTRYRMAAHVATLAEKEQLISDIRGLARDESASARGLADRIEHTLRVHDSGQSERESFMQIHDELSPDFTKRLKSDFPTLTEAQLRMAVYVAAGLSNQQISRMMSISVDSVHKSRYRLRKLLGVAHGASLEDFLRHYST